MTAIETVGDLLDELAPHETGRPVFVWADHKARPIASIVTRHGQTVIRIEWDDETESNTGD